MSRIFLYTFAAAVAVIGFIVWRGFVETGGNHLVPAGKIGRVRVQKLDENVALPVIDFNVRNESDRDMVVRSIDVTVNMPDGSKVDGANIAMGDAEKVFSAYPALGEKFNPGIKERDKIAPHQSVDLMVISRSDVNSPAMEQRKNISLAVEDVTGPTLKLEAR